MRGAVNFRTAKVWERVLSERCVYIDFAHGLFSIGALDMPKMSQGAGNGFWAKPIFILGKLKDFDWNGVGRNSMEQQSSLTKRQTTHHPS